MARRKTYDRNTDLDHIREDIDSLRHNVVALSKTMRHEMADKASSRIGEWEQKGREALETVEEDVRQKPMQSVLIAFGAGLLLSALMRGH